MKKLSVLFAALTLTLVAFTGPWTEYKTKDGKASIKFPEQPAESNQEVPTEVGNITMNIVSFEPAEGGADPNLNYSFIYSDYPDTLINSNKSEEDVKSFFEGSVNGAAKNVDGKIISQEDNKISGYPGKRIKIDYGNGQAVIDMQMYLVNNRMYFLQVVYLAENASDNLAAEQFMGSFKLLK